MNELARRKTLTFAQAEGAAQLPRQLKLKEVSQELRAVLWGHFHKSMSQCQKAGMYGPAHIGEPWRTVLLDRHVFVEHRMADEFNSEFDSATSRVKSLIQGGNYIVVLDFIQWVLRHPRPPIHWANMQDILEHCRAAYRILEEGPTIVPIASAEEGETIQRAFADLAAKEYHGARAHLRLAAEHLTKGECADSIRESIHAVESVARSIEPTGTLAGALQQIENKYSIHSALKTGFSKLYGFTSDEKGIRHPLLEKGAAAVDETDALFMIGACAAFVSYLIGRTR